MKSVSFLRIFRQKQKPPPVYATKVVEKREDDGSWLAELSKDGAPYAHVRVFSISRLLARWN